MIKLLRVKRPKGILKENYTVRGIDYQTAMDVVVNNHYLHRTCPCSRAYGLYDKSEMLKGAVTYGVPSSYPLLKGICGKEEAANVYELNRLWVSDDVPPNGESFLIANSLKLLDKEIIVSFADTSMGHIGYIYQATNFLYCGLSVDRDFKDPIIKGLETKHNSSVAYGLTMKQVEDKYGTENVKWVPRSRKHRYIYFNAPKLRRKELRKKLRYEVLPYPKGKVEAVKTVTQGQPTIAERQMSLYELIG